jgi:pyridoxamine 5'-phosphate oxidase
MAVDPIARFRRWFIQAQRSGIPLPEARALATADGRARPAVRYVLLKQADGRGFVFFSNEGSRKGRELRRNPRASAAFYWDRLRKQVRIEGRISAVSAAEADAYWATRPRQSQLAALTSRQSAVLAHRRDLLARFRTLRRAYQGKAVPRPRGWVGYRIVPESIEFWVHHEHRLHDRQLFRRTRNGWRRLLLQP